MDISPVYSSCSGKTGFAIFSVLRIVKLVVMNLAKSVHCSAPDSFLFSLTLFFYQFGLCNIADDVCSKYWTAVFLHTNLIKGKRHQTVCTSIKFDYMQDLILISHHPH